MLSLCRAAGLAACACPWLRRTRSPGHPHPPILGSCTSSSSRGLEQARAVPSSNRQKAEGFPTASIQPPRPVRLRRGPRQGRGGSTGAWGATGTAPAAQSRHPAARRELRVPAEGPESLPPVGTRELLVQRSHGQSGVPLRVPGAHRLPPGSARREHPALLAQEGREKGRSAPG